MALFGADKNARDAGVKAEGDRLTYIELSANYQTPQRVAFPTGYAPFPDLGPQFKSLEWDTRNGHPFLSRAVSDMQRQKIRALFTTRETLVEPFPVSHISMAAAISEELPKQSEVRPVEPTPASPAQPRANVVFAFLLSALVFAAGWAVLKTIPADSLRSRIIIGILVAIGSSVILFLFNIKDELTLISVSVFGIFVFTISFFF